MLHVVIAYDRPNRDTIVIDKFRDWREAVERRIELDNKYWDDPDVEVVTLAASSMEAIKRTHGRYFASDSELVDRVVDASRAWTFRERLLSLRKNHFQPA